MRRISRPEVFCNFIRKETLAQVFSCEFCEIFKNTFFIEHLRLLLLHEHFEPFTVSFTLQRCYQDEEYPVCYQDEENPGKIDDDRFLRHIGNDVLPDVTLQGIESIPKVFTHLPAVNSQKKRVVSSEGDLKCKLTF